MSIWPCSPSTFAQCIRASVTCAIFPPPCLFDTDDIILERVSDGGGRTFPHFDFYTPT